MNLISSEMASGAVRFFERAIGKTMAATPPSSLAQLRLNPQQIRAQLAATVPLTPVEVKRAMARQVKKGSCGRGGLPEYVIRTMYADYLALKSLAKAGKLYGRTRQSSHHFQGTRPGSPRKSCKRRSNIGAALTPQGRTATIAPPPAIAFRSTTKCGRINSDRSPQVTR